MSTVRSARLAVLALIVMSMIWGYNWVVMKQVVRYVDPFDFSAIRTLLAAVALFGVIIVARRPWRPQALRPLLVLGLLQTAIFTGLIQWALVSGGAGKTAILVYTMPFWLMPLAWFALGERMSGVQWIAMSVAAVGLALILQPWAMGGSVVSNALAVGGGLTWALATVVAKRIRREHDFDLLSMTAWQMLFGAIALCAVALIVPSRPIDPVPYFFGALFFNAVFATGLAWLLWLYVLQNLPAGVAGLSALGIPLIGAFAGWVELGERPGTVELSGMALICLALALTSLWPLLRSRRVP